MAMRKGGLSVPVVCLTTCVVLLQGQPAPGGVYPVNGCVSSKQKQAGGYCKAVLTAWAKWNVRQDATERDAVLAKAAATLDDKWAEAEARALAKGSDCFETTLTSAAARAQIDSAVAGIVAQVNTGLDLGSRAQAMCGGTL